MERNLLTKLYMEEDTFFFSIWRRIHLVDWTGKDGAQLYTHTDTDTHSICIYTQTHTQTHTIYVYTW
jgi:hypothetical protein